MNDHPKTLWQEFCTKTYLHGVPFLCKKSFTSLEKFVWSLLILLSLVGCSYMFFVGYQKWNNDTVVITYATKSYSVWRIPFPAVTICPVTRTCVETFNLMRTLELFSRYGRNRMSDEEYRRYRSLAHVCTDNSVFINFTEQEEENIVGNLRNMSVPLEDAFERCSWRGDVIECRDLFSEVLTDEGVCFNFNLLTAQDLLRTENLHTEYEYVDAKRRSSTWSMEKEVFDSFAPRKALSSGIKSGLSVVLRMRKCEAEYICKGGVDGFKVVLHSPDQFPMVSNFFFRVPLYTSAVVFIKPQYTKVSSSMDNQNLAKRQCFFNSERYLRFFKVYNQNNCYVECIANYTLDKCGCVKFSAPRSSDERICDASKISCYEKSFVGFLERSIGNRLHERKGICQCLPACYELQYNKELSYTPYNATAKAVAQKQLSEEFLLFSRSQLRIAMKTDRTIPLTRRRLSKLPDLLANMGGLFGLFIGGTVISLLEIVYFCCIKSVRSMSTYNRRNRTPPVLPWVP